MNAPARMMATLTPCVTPQCRTSRGCQAGSSQEQWLRADLASHPTKCTLAYWHHPLFSSGVKPSHALHPEMRPIWQALYEAGAELVVNGHEHNYERFAPQTPEGVSDPQHGVREIVAGVGGRSFDALVEPKANSEIRTTIGVEPLALRNFGHTCNGRAKMLLRYPPPDGHL